MKTKYIVYILITTVVLSISFCSFHKKGDQKNKFNKEMPLNISVFLDLSDRLTRPMTPSQMSRDTTIVNQLVDLFIQKSFECKPNLLNSDNHIKIFFYPTPCDPNINNLSNCLDVDLKELRGAEKRKNLITMKDNINNSLTKIYENTLQSKNWIGSDIWGFFSDKKIDQCLRKGNRNIIVILSDGYIYDINNKQQNVDSFSYILPNTLSMKSSNLLVRNKGLDNLEVLMMEINPYNIGHKDKMEKIIQSWFKDMGVKKVKLYATDIPSNTKNFISEFINDNK